MGASRWLPYANPGLWLFMLFMLGGVWSTMHMSPLDVPVSGAKFWTFVDTMALPVVTQSYRRGSKELIVVGCISSLYSIATSSWRLLLPLYLNNLLILGTGWVYFLGTECSTGRSSRKLYFYSMQYGIVVSARSFWLASVAHDCTCYVVYKLN